MLEPGHAGAVLGSLMTRAPSPNVANVPVSDEFQSVTELATTLGITPRTIRFYEARGLIALRRVGNMRITSRAIGPE